jgi:hypothetical protein
MKKRILGGIAVLAIAAVAAINVNMSSQSENLLSDLALANVEALAQESGGRGCTSDISAICETIHNDWWGYRNN